MARQSGLAGLVLAKYEYDMVNGVLYSPPRARIVFLVYRIHIQAVEYEYDMNIFKYILSHLQSEKRRLALDQNFARVLEAEAGPAVLYSYSGGGPGAVLYSTRQALRAGVLRRHAAGCRAHLALSAEKHIGTERRRIANNAARGWFPSLRACMHRRHWHVYHHREGSTLVSCGEHSGGAQKLPGSPPSDLGETECLIFNFHRTLYDAPQKRIFQMCGYGGV
ncbi:hypothetical protein B0H11DRAFT_1919560 [Mycena galericulata]|nr:hypothetical protein B0H11DRAFT_1919560 [Mycena galericulata]